MGKYVALLRGINVGGNNKVAMSELKDVFKANGFEDVATYINSGNLLFSIEENDKWKLKEVCEALIEEHFQAAIPVTVFSAKDMQEMADHVPAWWGSEEGAKHNALFVIPPATAQEVVASVGPVRPEYEKVAYYDGVIFWSAQLKTFSRTRWSKIVGTPAYANVTVRNANTFRKLVLLAQ